MPRTLSRREATNPTITRVRYYHQIWNCQRIIKEVSLPWRIPKISKRSMYLHHHSQMFNGMRVLFRMTKRVKALLTKMVATQEEALVVVAVSFPLPLLNNLKEKTRTKSSSWWPSCRISWTIDSMRKFSMYALFSFHLACIEWWKGPLSGGPCQEDSFLLMVKVDRWEIWEGMVWFHLQKEQTHPYE